MNDVFLTLAYAPNGLTCFAVPRVLPDGTRNSSDPSPERARRLAVLITLCLQASLLVQHSPAVVAEAFLGSRFGGDVPGWTSLPARSDTRLLVERVTHRWG
ncbi:MAG: hypothetical protein M3300_06655 [Actinomycetota bacterium]|nr:hypothetical protein [Actinomycetota bacterium]